jgi:hypothetical protein
MNQKTLEADDTRIPKLRHFLSDFLAGEKNATRARALIAWQQLKKAEIPKNYREWKKKYGKSGA